MTPALLARLALRVTTRGDVLFSLLQGCVDGETLVTSDYNAEDMIKQLRIKREICYGTFREHYCTTREMHFTSLDETRRPFIFEEPRIPGRFHYGLEVSIYTKKDRSRPYT